MTDKIDAAISAALNEIFYSTSSPGTKDGAAATIKRHLSRFLYPEPGEEAKAVIEELYPTDGTEDAATYDVIQHMRASALSVIQRAINARCARLEAELAAAKPDTERLDELLEWAQAHPWEGVADILYDYGVKLSRVFPKIDRAAIDAAMSAEAKDPPR